ncbi:MAG: glycerol-3-phosphate dehydrogenase/oxidase [Acidobacteria bacterium]|nr:glycerol-3-phosphate dehydrogenase/oxidase [Acidobacteriota bacterium]
MNRNEMLNSVRKRREPYDIIVIGGGATGAGCAVDAASRGLDVLLVEQHDFGKGTSSRSTKLVHGGVRYLEQGNISLVREALKERGILRKNAPHIVRKQSFIIPCYSFWQKLYYGFGLKVYDLLSGKYSFGKSKILSREKTFALIPSVQRKNLAGSVIYYDGQFDDARLLIDLMATAAGRGATILNYAKVIRLSKDQAGRIDGVSFECAVSGETFETKAKVVINATGAFADEVRNLSDDSSPGIVTHSQGIHLVFKDSMLQTAEAIMIPKTSDGRVLFAIPWNGKTLVGTTDTPINEALLEPTALETEIDFILATCRQYFADPPRREDVLSIFAGIRPLVKDPGADNTASISRDHTIEIDHSGLLTITGGKWTTYRSMAEDAVNKAIGLAGTGERSCITGSLPVKNSAEIGIAEIAAEDPSLDQILHEDFSYRRADIVNAVRNEMAQTLEDVLARRTRMLFLDAAAAIKISSAVAEIMAIEMKKDGKWIRNQVDQFNEVAQNYLVKAK